MPCWSTHVPKDRSARSNDEAAARDAGIPYRRPGGGGRSGAVFYLSKEDPRSPIRLLVNSPGGSPRRGEETIARGETPGFTIVPQVTSPEGAAEQRRVRRFCRPFRAWRLRRRLSGGFAPGYCLRAPSGRRTTMRKPPHAAWPALRRNRLASLFGTKGKFPPSMKPPGDTLAAVPDPDGNTVLTRRRGV